MSDSNRDPLDEFVTTSRSGGDKSPHPRWYQALEGEITIEEVVAERRGLDTDAALAAYAELFRPIDELSQRRMLQAARRAANGGRSVRRRAWVWSGGLALATASLILLMIRPPEPPPEPPPERLTADVEATHAIRGAGAQDVPLEVAASSWFYLRCAARDPGLAFKVETVIARSAEGDEERHLEFDPALSGEPKVQAFADLPPGRWRVTCGGVVAESRYFAWLDPPAIIVVQ